MIENSLATIEWQQLGMEFGSSAVLGGIIGFAVKKVAKLVLILIGLEILVLKILEIYGIIDVHWEGINSFVATIRRIFREADPVPRLPSVLPSLSIGGGFTGGFVAGFKRG